MKREVHNTLTENRTAVFSDDEQYRYSLAIGWNPFKPLLIAICLNPSTATHLVNDPTVERMCRRAQKQGFGGFVMLNLFAYRATDPKDMKAQEDPVGPENDAVLLSWFMQAAVAGHTVMCGWGAHGDHQDRDVQVMNLMAHAGVKPVCLEVTANGKPKHPLYVGYDKQFVEFLS